MINTERIFNKVETTACACAKCATGQEVQQEDLYSYQRKPPFVVFLAKSLAMMVMHDMYGIKYHKIAKRASMTLVSTINAVAKARERRFYDPVYKHCYELMKTWL